MAKTVPLTCTNCSKQFLRFPSRAKRAASKFCSLNCYLAQKKASRVGCINPLGYRQLSIDGRSVLEHRMVAEKILGRPLLKTEVVHHINGNRADNRPENLEVISSSAAHLRQHGEERWALAEALFLRDAGLTYAQIGEALGVSGRTVHLRLKRNDAITPFVRKGVPRNRRKTSEEVAALRAQFAASS